MSKHTETARAIKEVIESAGIQIATESLRELLESGKVKPEDYSIKELREAVSSDLFPTITGEIISAKIIESNKLASGIGDQLCTTVPSKMETEKVAGFEAGDFDIDEIPEGSEYNDSTMSEKHVTIKHVKKGRLISITEEMVYYDKTGQVLDHARKIGEVLAYEREKIIVQGIMDSNTTVYKPSGIATAFWSAGNANVETANPFGESGVLAALKNMGEQTDEDGNYIFVDNSRLIGLFPFDLWVQSAQMVQSTLTPESAEQAKNVFKGLFIPLTSPWLTASNASTWYLGDFKRDFRWSEVWPLQVFTMRQQSDSAFRKDLAAIYKCRYLGNIGATDFRHCVRSTT